MGAYNYSFYLLLAWLPTYLSATHHVDLLHSALFTAIPWIFATLVDVLLGGLLVDTLIRRGHDPDRVRRSVLLGGTTCGLALLGAGLTSSLPVALLCISLALGGLATAAPVLWSVPGLITDRQSVGKVSGIANFFGQISAIAAPILTGYSVTRTHTFLAAFALAAAYLSLGIAAYVLLLGKLHRPTFTS